ncbi:MAG: aminoacetone oxidase family FAD-binding enzyme [Candidatus Paceibacterota bacterium]
MHGKDKKLLSNDTIWDVAIIGGGPAGMMAAGRAAELGRKVILIEKNPTLGRKLLITGGGRCNVTNAEYDNRKLIERFKEDGKYLFSAFSQWSVKETLDFFHKRDMPTKIENELRVFPESNKAQSVWNVLVGYMKEHNVTILSNSQAIGIIEKDKTITGIRLKNNKVIVAKNIIIAMGGTSHPETGSTGDAYSWLKKLGHKVVEPEPSLVPLAIKDAWVKRLAGVSLQNIKLTVFQNGVKQEIRSGKNKIKSALGSKILFTHVGVSGPTILNMSRDVGELLKYGEVTISLDLLPTLDYSALNLKLQEVFRENDKKRFKNCLGSIVPSSLATAIVELSGIAPEKECNSVTREERLLLVNLLKAIPMNVEKLLGKDKAIISSGGVALEEVDFRTMSSRIFPNLYFVGDILNIDRPSGGYSLQLCWTTGFVAGSSAARNFQNTE